MCKITLLERTVQTDGSACNRKPSTLRSAVTLRLGRTGDVRRAQANNNNLSRKPRETVVFSSATYLSTTDAHAAIKTHSFTLQ